MRRRDALWLLALPAACFAGAAASIAGAPASAKIRGKLKQPKGQPPALELNDHKLVPLDGDASTKGVLNDSRLAGADMEVAGHFANPNQFLVDPFYTKAVHVYKDGKRRSVSHRCATR